ncbi:GntR family transcriptional regulator [Mycolicibacterium hodleri]|uniref:GntR family transcriptional regulator n=1 Tax=Mycolicibacterium hodleri TaxID=49897 RepID=A0A502EJI4_9MYCO|nr:GntR family transcriptional regulator [Mycolicibacterium hodleri]TPG37132.1 GntR family transcriptional regulator [Mycolicibacterium hodleri]
MTTVDPDGGAALNAPVAPPAPAADDRLSLSHYIYSTVRERIILGQYPQGSRLPEQRIGEELNVSRVPLREAVPWLERDGFVHSRPRRGAVVTGWDAKTIDDLFDVRLSLEAGAARYAARQVSLGGPMDALNRTLDEAQRTVAGGDAYAIARTSTAFHEAVVQTSSNELMVRLMQSISGRITWLFFLTSGLPADEAFHDHVLLRDAIASGNERVAESVAYAHIERDRQPTHLAMRDRMDA